MIDILRRLRKIALRRAQKEFERWNETWNPPYPLFGTAAAAGLLGAVLCQIVTMLTTIALIWEIRHNPQFWLIVVSVAFSYGALPGLALGGISGLAQALAWTRRSRLAGLTCLAGGTATLAWLAYTLMKLLNGDPNWMVDLLWLLLLFSASLLWSLVLLLNGARLMRVA